MEPISLIEVIKCVNITMNNNGIKPIYGFIYGSNIIINKYINIQDKEFIKIILDWISISFYDNLIKDKNKLLIENIPDNEEEYWSLQKVEYIYDIIENNFILKPYCFINIQKLKYSKQIFKLFCNIMKNKYKNDKNLHELLDYMHELIVEY
jgi:hypothetical protein